jgi:hypothetical protein
MPSRFYGPTVAPHRQPFDCSHGSRRYCLNVAGCHGQARAPHQIADGRGIGAARDELGSEEVPEVSEPHVPHSGRLAFSAPDDWLIGGGEMARLIKTKDWSIGRR